MREPPACISSGYSALTCAHAMCSRLREPPGLHYISCPAATLVSSGSDRARRETLHPRFTGFLRIECFRPGEKNIAVGQIERASIAMMREMRRQVANLFRGKVQFHGSPKVLRGTKFSSIVRPIRAFSERCHMSNVRGQVISRTFAGSDAAVATETQLIADKLRIRRQSSWLVFDVLELQAKCPAGKSLYHFGWGGSRQRLTRLIQLDLSA